MDDLPERLDFENAESREYAAGAADAGSRLDRFLMDRLEGFSRAALQRLIRGGSVRLNDAPARPAARLRPGDRVALSVPEIVPFEIEPQDLPLRVLLEDPAFVVLDKAPGMPVHPGRGRPDGTVANAIAHRYGSTGLGGEAHRPGIVHRLDLETSGVLLVALRADAHAALAAAFKERVVAKEYRALVHGRPVLDEETIDLPLGRDAFHPTRMAVRFDQGRPSQTTVSVVARYAAASDVCCRPRTGRTHQIRVHLASRGHPLLGDPAYAGGRRDPVDVPRVMLHAHRLAFPHPATGATVHVEAPLPADFLAIDLGPREG